MLAHSVMLASLIRVGDLAGRYGGEEFLVIFPMKMPRVLGALLSVLPGGCRSGPWPE